MHDKYRFFSVPGTYKNQNFLYKPKNRKSQKNMMFDWPLHFKNREIAFKNAYYSKIVGSWICDDQSYNAADSLLIFRLRGGW